MTVIKDVIIKFFKQRQQNEQYEFHSHQLERFVHQEYVGLIAEGSILRQLRYLKEEGRIDYDVPDKTKSTYVIAHKK